MFRQAPSFPYHDLGIVEDGNTASRAISKDSYVIWKGESYFASTDILQGATLEEDVNLTAIPDGVINGVVEAMNSKIIKVLTGTTGATSSTTTVPYPTGFSVDNTILLNYQYYDGGGWRPLGGETGWANMGSYHPAVTLWEDGVHIYTDGSNTANKNFKVTIMKYS